MLQTIEWLVIACVVAIAVWALWRLEVGGRRARALKRVAVLKDELAATQDDARAVRLMAKIEKLQGRIDNDAG